MHCRLKQTAFSRLERRSVRLWGSIAKPLTCRRQREAHMPRTCASLGLKPFAPCGMPSPCARRADRGGIACPAQARPAVHPLPERSGFSRRSL